MTTTDQPPAPPGDDWPDDDLVTALDFDDEADTSQDADETDGDTDAESYITAGETLGGPIDLPSERWNIYDAVKASANRSRPPIVPTWLRSRDQRRAFSRQLADVVGYHVGMQVSRSPLYIARTCIWAPWGAVKLARRQIAWWWLAEQHGLRQQAATRNQYDEWLALHREAKRTRRWRGMVMGAEAAGLAIAGGTIVAGPWWLQLAAAAIGGPPLAAVGMPDGRPLIDRTVSGPRFTRLTAEMVRLALVDVGAAKQPGDLQFPPPGIHRDGPGWLARVNLPRGKTAVAVLEKRDELSSALRLPVDQVWPAAGPDHAGQLDLWVSYIPVSRMGQPKWSLASPSARTSVFEAADFATDQRQRPIRTKLFQRNFLIGGVPGSGKSFAARDLLIIAALDPTCELKVCEFKGTGDFLEFAPLASTYICGVDDEAFEGGMSLLQWGLAEAERRGRRIKQAKERGEAPEGKVTPELARRPGSGLHPVFIMIDEVHELFGDSEHGKAAGQAAIRLAKRGRALNLILVLATQIPDKDTVPPALTRCINVRWCLAVLDYFANDMILGTGAYKRGLAATVYRPEVDAGWGICVGIAKSGPIKSFYPTEAEIKTIIRRAHHLRGSKIIGDTGPMVETRDIIADALAAFRPSEKGLHWQTLADRLSVEEPEAYAGINQDAVSALLRSKGVPSVDVKFAGSSRMGCRKEALQKALGSANGGRT